MADDVRLRVAGLRELRTALRRVDRRLPKELAKVGKRVARIVVVEARPRVPVGPAAGGHAASSIKPRATQKGASVVEGGNKFPYMPWIDFGGQIHPHPGQDIHRPYLRKGRFIWAAYAERRQEVQRQYLDGVRDVLRAAGLDVD